MEQFFQLTELSTRALQLGCGPCGSVLRLPCLPGLVFGLLQTQTGGGGLPVGRLATQVVKVTLCLLPRCLRSAPPGVGLLLGGAGQIQVCVITGTVLGVLRRGGHCRGRVLCRPTDGAGLIRCQLGGEQGGGVVQAPLDHILPLLTGVLGGVGDGPEGLLRVADVLDEPLQPTRGLHPADGLSSGCRRLIQAGGGSREMPGALLEGAAAVLKLLDLDTQCLNPCAQLLVLKGSRGELVVQFEGTTVIGRMPVQGIHGPVGLTLDLTESSDDPCQVLAGARRLQGCGAVRLLRPAEDMFIVPQGAEGLLPRLVREQCPLPGSLHVLGPAHQGRGRAVLLQPGPTALGLLAGRPVPLVPFGPGHGRHQGCAVLLEPGQFLAGLGRLVVSGLHLLLRRLHRTGHRTGGQHGPVLVRPLGPVEQGGGLVVRLVVGVLRPVGVPVRAQPVGQRLIDLLPQPVSDLLVLADGVGQPLVARGQVLLHVVEPSGAEETAQQDLLVLGVRAQEPCELPLGQHDHVHELLRVQRQHRAQQLTDLIRPHGELRPGAVPQLTQLCTGLLLGVLGPVTAAALPRAKVLGPAQDLESAAAQGHLQQHLRPGSRRGMRAGQGVHGAPPGNAAVEGEAHGREHRGLAGSGGPVQQEQPCVVERLQVHGLPSGERAEGLQLDAVDPHALCS